MQALQQVLKCPQANELLFNSATAPQDANKEAGEPSAVKADTAALPEVVQATTWPLDSLVLLGTSIGMQLPALEGEQAGQSCELLCLIEVLPSCC